jgi:hypothetical protein
VVKQRGLIGAASHVAQAIVNRVINHQQLVFELPREVAGQYHAAAPASAQVLNYRSLAEIPCSFIDVLVDEHGLELKSDLVKTFRGGATLFLVLYEGRPATMLWAKRGIYVTRWYLPLTESDVVLYGWHTSPQYRGMNLIGVAMESAIACFSGETNRFLADVKTWNKPSIRAMEKAGFRFLLKSKPLA